MTKRKLRRFYSLNFVKKKFNGIFLKKSNNNVRACFLIYTKKKTPMKLGKYKELNV